MQSPPVSVYSLVRAVPSDQMGSLPAGYAGCGCGQGPDLAALDTLLDSWQGADDDTWSADDDDDDDLSGEDFSVFEDYGAFEGEDEDDDPVGELAGDLGGRKKRVKRRRAWRAKRTSRRYKKARSSNRTRRQVRVVYRLALASAGKAAGKRIALTRKIKGIRAAMKAVRAKKSVLVAVATGLRAAGLDSGSARKHARVGLSRALNKGKGKGKAAKTMRSKMKRRQQQKTAKRKIRRKRKTQRPKPPTQGSNEDEIEDEIEDSAFEPSGQSEGYDVEDDSALEDEDEEGYSDEEGDEDEADYDGLPPDASASPYKNYVPLILLTAGVVIAALQMGKK